MQEPNTTTENGTNSIQSPSSSSSNQELDTTDIDMATIEKLRGDAIGDTMYSERFVLKTLLNFSNLIWTDDVENDLCSLWDMTTESTVCDYLLRLSYPKLACNAIEKYPEQNRFIEIVIGILANLLCSSTTTNCNDSIHCEEIDCVLNVIKTDDSLILIQIMRFLHALMFAFPHNNYINEDRLKQIGFILENSINEDLIVHTLRVVGSFTTQFKEKKEILDQNLLQSVLIGYEQIINESFECNFDEENTKNATKYFFEILCNLCYCAECNQQLFKIEPYRQRIIEIVTNLLNYYINGNLLPITNDFCFYLKAFTFIFRTLQYPYDTDIVNNLITILSIIKDQSIDDLDDCLELFCYFITKIDKNIKLSCDLEKLKILLVWINERKFQYDFDYLNHVETLLNNFEVEIKS